MQWACIDLGHAGMIAMTDRATDCSIIMVVYRVKRY